MLISVSRAALLSAILCTAVLLAPATSQGQTHSVARQWNDALLESIRQDLSRPTVHARNLFHSSIASYDAWAAMDDVAQPFILGSSFAGAACPFDSFEPSESVEDARAAAVSYANYRLLSHRFGHSPSADLAQARFDSLFQSLGYDRFLTSTDYKNGSGAQLGNYIAKCVIDAGLRDGSNEQNNYANVHYKETNPPLLPIVDGNPDIVDPNRFQPLGIRTFIDQGGNVFATGVPDFLSAEWGSVSPFALLRDDVTIHSRNGDTYEVFYDPGPPPYIEPGVASAGTLDYQWAFSLVSTWSSHLDPSDGVMWDISPGAIGNISAMPQTVEGMKAFYDYANGGDPGLGRPLNPRTNKPYEANVVPRGDYTRVLAEFWADGPSSETPPGHWFTILNYVSDSPLLEKRFNGKGEILDDLEWDVKAYLALGGAVHDSAVSAWGIKGWYDYIRPISAIRYMADHGQCTDPQKANFSLEGIPLVDGFIEMVEEGDRLAGLNNENVDKVKVKAWRGPDYIVDADVDMAGVGWILAENWWPYQRPTFVTPPFAGYISGHSTFSRAAAEVLTQFTGDEYFPGGLGEFHAPKDEFLVFEDGPSVDVTLQWATYRDASDQTSLSRIWGGIHPPVDDIPGRIIGERIGNVAFSLASKYFAGQAPVGPLPIRFLSFYPSPVASGRSVNIVLNGTESGTVQVFDLLGRQVLEMIVADETHVVLNTGQLSSGQYLVRFTGVSGRAGKVLTVI